MTHIFISYSRRDVEYARRLNLDLREHGFDVWFDEEIEYGDRWFRQIVKAIRASSAVVVVMTPDAEASEWVEREILLAQRDKKPLFPLLLSGQEFPLLITTQFGDVRDGEMPKDDFYDRLKEVVPPKERPGRTVDIHTMDLQTVPPRPLKKKGSNLFLWAGLAVLLLIVALAAFLILSKGEEENPSQTGQKQATVTATNSPSPTQTKEVSATPLPTPDLLATVTANEDWEPVVQEFEGVEMVLVPAGCFDLGSTAGLRDERPVENQCFEAPFWLDRYEVSNAQFAQLNGQARLATEFEGDDLPRQQITWLEASAFCAARRMRLPTEREWEYAARGPDGLEFPWGNNFDAVQVVFAENSERSPAAVGSKSASWVGAFDLSGNVAEWMNTVYDLYPYDPSDGRESPSDTRFRVVRGGSWFNDKPLEFRSASRYSNARNYADGRVGFRCAGDFASQ